MEKAITRKELEEMLRTLLSRVKIDEDNAIKKTKRLKKLKAEGKEGVTEEDIQFHAGRAGQAHWTYHDIRQLCILYSFNWDKIKKVII